MTKNMTLSNTNGYNPKLIDKLIARKKFITTVQRVYSVTNSVNKNSDGGWISFSLSREGHRKIKCQIKEK